MTSREQALQLLARAGESDRRWIVQRLSSGARARLTSGDDAGEPDRASSAIGAGDRTGLAADVIAKLEAADPGRIVDLLNTEPGWLISVLLRVHAWRWAKRVLEGLPSRLRAEVARLERSRLSLPPAALELLTRELAERAHAGRRAPTRQTPFDALLARLRNGRQR